MIHTLNTLFTEFLIMSHTLILYDSQSFSPWFTLWFTEFLTMIHTLSTLWFTQFFTWFTLQYSFDEKIQKVSIILNIIRTFRISPQENISPSRIECCDWFVLKPSRTRVIWIFWILLHTYYEKPVYVYMFY